MGLEEGRGTKTFTMRDANLRRRSSLLITKTSSNVLRVPNFLNRAVSPLDLCLLPSRRSHHAVKSPIALDWMSQSRFLSRTVFASSEGTKERTVVLRDTQKVLLGRSRSVEPLSPFFLFFFVFPPLSVRPSRCGLRKCQLRAIAALRVEQGGMARAVRSLPVL